MLKNRSNSNKKDIKFKDKHDMKRVMDNNLFMIKYMFRCTPVFMTFALFRAAFADIVVFFEHTYCIKYITDIIQYQGSFYDVLQYIMIISIVVTIKLLINALNHNYFKPKAKEKMNKQLRIELFN